MNKATDERGIMKARRNRLALAGVDWLVMSSLRRGFSTVRLKVTSGLDAPPPGAYLDRPAIYYLNHSSWWDGYLVYLLGRRVFQGDGYLMMDIDFLRKYRFFTWVGAFSIDRHNPRHAVQSLNYIAEVLQAKPGRSLWLFPQGETRANSRRPLHFHTGIAAIARKLPACYLYPVAIHLDYFTAQHPEALLSVGPGLRIDDGAAINNKALTEQARLRLEETLDQMMATVNAAQFDPPIADEVNFPGYRTILRGQSSASDRFERLFAPTASARPG